MGIPEPRRDDGPVADPALTQGPRPKNRVLLWVRFLEEARGISLWKANRPDVAAYHRARRRNDAGSRISAASWNRSVAAMEKLYKWAETEGLVSASPFTHRDVWRRANAGGRGRIVARNDAFERSAKQSDVRFVSLEDYRRFRDVGPAWPCPGWHGAFRRTGSDGFRAMRYSPNCWWLPDCGSRKHRSSSPRKSRRYHRPVLPLTSEWTVHYHFFWKPAGESAALKLKEMVAFLGWNDEQLRKRERCRLLADVSGTVNRANNYHQDRDAMRRQTTFSGLSNVVIEDIADRDHGGHQRPDHRTPG